MAKKNEPSVVDEPWFKVGPVLERPASAPVNSLYQSSDGNLSLYRYKVDGWVVEK